MICLFYSVVRVCILFLFFSVSTVLAQVSKVAGTSVSYTLTGASISSPGVVYSLALPTSLTSGEAAWFTTPSDGGFAKGVLLRFTDAGNGQIDIQVDANKYTGIASFAAASNQATYFNDNGTIGGGYEIGSMQLAGFTNSGPISNGVTTITDTEKPVIAAVANTTTMTAPSGANTASVSFTTTVFDNFDVAGNFAPVFTVGGNVITSPYNFSTGVTTVTVNANNDSAGNTPDPITFTVTVTDSEAPIFTNVPANINQSTDVGSNTAVVTFTTPTATDNIDGVITPILVTSPTAGLNSGSAFPSGITTLTYQATDTAGNTASKSFTVTVTDSEAPIFTNVPANINQSTDVGSNTAVVTFTTPTATDNIDGAITPILVTSPTAGLKSGSVFPVGVTTLTYQATDTAGNTASKSFTVTVTAAQGTITFIVNSEADGLYNIQSLEPMLNIPIIASSGEGQSSVISLPPGAFPITFKAPNGVGIESANCNNGNSTLNVGTLTGTIIITADLIVTCTIKAQDSFKETTAQIGQFIESRSQLILQNQPDLARQINYLERRYNNGGIKGFGLALNDDRIPVSAQIGTDKISFSYSSHKSRTNRVTPTLTGDTVSVLAAFGITPRAINKDESPFSSEISPSTLEKYITDPSNISSEKALNLKLPTVSNTQPSNKNYDYKTNPFGIWAEGSISKFKTNNGKGRFFITHIGADYLIKPDVLIGLSIQGDWLNMDGKNTESKTEGTGFLITPSVTAKLSEDLYLHASAGWGKSYNDISPFGTYTDNFDSERWIASAALIGKWKLNGFNIKHGANLTYFKETSDSYTDSLNVLIPSVKTETGTFKIGPTLSKDYTTDKGSIYTPFLTMKGIWTFSQNSRTTALDQKRIAKKGLRGRLELGFDTYSHNSSQFEFSTNYDGIGDSDFESWGITLNYNYQF